MKLDYLTDKALLFEMSSLVQRERALLSQVLWHLREIDRRKLYCELKCGSLFQYCVKVLKYSEGQASRRVTACRLLKELPEISHNIQKGEINLTQLNQAKGFFDEMNIIAAEEKKKIIDDIKGLTVKETDMFFAEKKFENNIPSKVNLPLKPETLQALYKLKALKAHSCPDMDSLIMKMIEVTTRAWDPTWVRQKRSLGSGHSRYIQVGVKASVWHRDQGKCSNCGSTYALELDHLHPFAMGGKTQIENLRLLCRNCNQRKGQEMVRRSFRT